MSLSTDDFLVTHVVPKFMVIRDPCGLSLV
uniref:Uncharacterized protein n=1 Tax=Arundo donax TaxID=35708 RepID=A0A0A9AB56_ARUDO